MAIINTVIISLLNLFSNCHMPFSISFICSLIYKFIFVPSSACFIIHLLLSQFILQRQSVWPRIYFCFFYDFFCVHMCLLVFTCPIYLTVIYWLVTDTLSQGLSSCRLFSSQLLSVKFWFFVYIFKHFHLDYKLFSFSFSWYF